MRSDYCLKTLREVDSPRLKAQLLLLYYQFLQEFNKGHYKRFIKGVSSLREVLSWFANQQDILLYFVDAIEEINRKLALSLKVQGMVLDAGCGMGGFSFPLASLEEVSKVYAVDVDRTALKIARIFQELPAHLCLSKEVAEKVIFEDLDVLSLENRFGESYFDVVFAKDLLEHLDSYELLEDAVCNFYSVLKRGGFLVVEVPNYLFVYEPHLRIPKFPYITSKRFLEAVARIYGRDASFVSQLVMTTPSNMRRALLNAGFRRVINVTEAVKLDFLFSGKLSLSRMWRFAKPLLRLFSSLGIKKVVSALKFYPTIQMLAIK